jgi:ADP-heptose:LPS heptosyltransferase
MRILFLRFGSIGNALVSVPAVRAVRREKPEAFLALLCDPATHDLWKDCPWLDRVLVYDSKDKNQAGPGYLKMIFELRKIGFTHSIHFRRYIRSELIGFLAGAQTRIGFDPGKISLLTKKLPYSEDAHIIEQNLQLVRELGIKADDRGLEYWPPAPSDRVKNLLAQLKAPLVVLHPFARTQKHNRWQKFPELAEKLKKDLNASVVLIGAGRENEIFQNEWQGKYSEFATAFDFSIPELASLLKSAKLFIGSDSGPLHLACAVGAPAISIYTPRPDLARHLKKWMPLAPRFKAVLPPENSHAEISVAEVLSAARDFLSQPL